MAKKVVGYIKLQVKAGQANPSPPVGPALGQRGLNIMEFCKRFNAATQAGTGLPIPTVITAYSDRTFTFVTKDAAGVDPAEEGRGHPVRLRSARTPKKVGKGHPQAARGHRQAKEPGSDRGRPGRGGAHHRGLGPFDGPRSVEG